MNIIIVDDSAANLVAAKKATERFPEHQFTFVSRASEAIKMLASADAIITDLFFLDENHGNNDALAEVYGEYCAKISEENETYSQIFCEYYDANIGRAQRGLIGAVDVVTNGLGVSSNKQFPYGGVVMLEAHKVGKRLCLISDIHSHASAASSVDGIILLLPLIERGVLTIKQAKLDGRGSLTYIGQDELNFAISGCRRGCIQKEQPESWAEAIRRIIAQ
ncbi:MAG: hypothetical protein WCJ51_02480 [Candidatus Moraniibacteriota bacterium]